MLYCYLSCTYRVWGYDVKGVPKDQAKILFTSFGQALMKLCMCALTGAGAMTR
jgi:hypothetical protein